MFDQNSTISASRLVDDSDLNKAKQAYDILAKYGFCSNSNRNYFCDGNGYISFTFLSNDKIREFLELTELKGQGASYSVREKYDGPSVNPHLAKESALVLRIDILDIDLPKFMEFFDQQMIQKQAKQHSI